MLVYQHPDGYPAHVKPIQEVLYGVFGAGVYFVALL